MLSKKVPMAIAAAKTTNKTAINREETKNFKRENERMNLFFVQQNYHLLT